MSFNLANKICNPLLLKNLVKHHGLNRIVRGQQSAFARFSTLNVSTSLNSRKSETLTLSALSYSKAQPQNYNFSNCFSLFTTSSPKKHSSRCGCCGLHTEGDREMSQFLSEEIELEKKGEQPLTSIKGFNVETDGSEITFSSKTDGETVTLKLNINHAMEEQISEENIPDGNKMLCKPPFTIEIVKGDLVLSMSCIFPNYDVPEEVHGEEKYDDIIEIQEVSVYKGDFKEQVYSVSGGIIDGTLYDMLLNTMEERGLTGGFFDSLIEYCTLYEHKQYIEFLESLQKFAKSS